MDVRRSPRLPKSPSTASSSSTGRVEEREVQEEEDNNNHRSKQINNLISSSFIPPKLKPNASPIPAKRPVSKLKTAPASTATTTVEESQVAVEEEPKMKKKEKNAGAVTEKDPPRVKVWTEENEILLLREMADSIKRGENPNSDVFYESFKPKISVNVTYEQIKTKIRHSKNRFEAKVELEKKGGLPKFATPHLQKCHELSKPIWGSGGEGSETVVVENEDEVGKSQRGKKRKAVSMRQTKDGNATGANEQLEEVDAVAENLEAATVEKQDGSEAADQANKKKQGKQVGHETGEKQDGSEAADQAKKKKQGKQVGHETGEKQDGAKGREEVDQANKKKQVGAKTVEKQDGAKGSEVADQANKKKQVKQVGARSSEAADQGNKKKQVGDKKHGKTGAGDVEATADGQEERKKAEKERIKKKKKRIEVHIADNVLKPAADKQQECLYQLLNHQCREQLTKAPFDLESSLKEKTIQSIEPSKLMAYNQNWKEIQIAEVELFLKKNDLARQGSLMLLEALKRTTY